MNTAEEIVLNERVARLEVIAEITTKTLDRLERHMDAGFREVRLDVKDLRGEFQALRSHVDNTFRWLIGTQIMTTLAVIGLIAKSAKLF